MIENYERFKDESEVPVYVFAMVKKNHLDLKIIEEAYKKHGAGLMIDWSKIKKI